MWCSVHKASESFGVGTVLRENEAVGVETCYARWAARLKLGAACHMHMKHLHCSQGNTPTAHAKLGWTKSSMGYEVRLARGLRGARLPRDTVSGAGGVVSWGFFAADFCGALAAPLGAEPGFVPGLPCCCFITHCRPDMPRSFMAIKSAPASTNSSTIAAQLCNESIRRYTKKALWFSCKCVTPRAHLASVSHESGSIWMGVLPN